MTGGIVVWVTGDGKITYKDNYQDAVERLCQLEDNATAALEITNPVLQVTEGAPQPRMRPAGRRRRGGI